MFKRLSIVAALAGFAFTGWGCGQQTATSETTAGKSAALPTYEIGLLDAYGAVAIRDISISTPAIWKWRLPLLSGRPS